MASELSDEMVEAAARALCKYDSDPQDMWSHYVDAASTALTAALAVQARTHVVVDKTKAAASIADMVAEWYYGALARSGRRHIPASVIEQRLERLSMLAASTEDKP